MASEIEKIANNLFEKIRSRFEEVSLGDDKAQATADPELARFFNFDYVSRDGEKFGNVTISLIDNDSLKIYFSKNISEKLDPTQLKEWYAFLYEMRKFARRNLMTFDTRDISRSNLKLKDVKNISQSDKTFTSKDVSAVTESRLYGTPKTSFENVGTARLRILHTESVNPDVRGSRARHINAIYVENSQGERFRLQSNKLPGARAIARHISEGGTPWDEVGQHINSMLQEMTDLSTFVRGMRRRTFEDGVATKMVEAAVAHYGNLHKQLNNLKSPRAYKTFVENFEPQAQQLDEVDLNELKERFVKKIFDDRMTAALPHVYKAYQLQEQYKQTQVESIKQVIEGQAVLTLSTNEGMDEYMKMLRFQDTGSLVKSVLEDIATRAVTTMPEVADFASHWAKNYDTITETASEDILESQALAVQLATHYLRDLRNLKENTSLRIQVQRDETDLDPGPDLLGESTMHYPRTPEELQAFQQVLAQPIPFGMDATNVTSAIGDLIFDDELFDRLGELSDDLGEQADAVPAIKEWLKDNWPGMYERLGFSNQEIDTPAVAPTQPPAPTPQTTAAAPTQNPVGLSEELKQMLRIAGLAK